MASIVLVALKVAPPSTRSAGTCTTSTANIYTAIRTEYKYRRSCLHLADLQNFDAPFFVIRFCNTLEIAFYL
jgi:hypothetical protein